MHIAMNRKMHQGEMESTQENGSDFSVISKGNEFSWSSETNWVIAHGSLEDSVTAESSDSPIAESDPETTTSKSPLVLRPRGPDSGPCEIKLRFQRKYEILQIYVRSTARVYEVYYAHSSNSSNEYLCTVRCGVAERDEKLQINCVEDVAVECGGSLVGELTEETGTHGENVVSSEDDWVKIKVPEVLRSSVSDEISTNGVKNVQDLYEATAQISDADPCSLLTIRLLSLQDKGHVYVDEVYVFVDPVESIDSGKEAELTGYSAQSSLMAMFVPTLLQLSKSGANRIQDKQASDKLFRDDYMETGSTRIGRKMENGSTAIDGRTQDGATGIGEKVENGSTTIDEKTENGSTRIDEEVEPESGRINEIDVGLEINQIHQQPLKPKELDKSTAELEQTALTKKCVEPLNINDALPGQLGRALEQLISRVSRVEDICLRFEEKMLKPIANIEARLQRVEHELEGLAKNSQCSGTRFYAPAFSCSESISRSFHNEQNDHPSCGPSKDFSCNTMAELSCDAKSHPILVVKAPEFSCGEDEGINDDSKPLKDFSCNDMPELSHNANVDPGLVCSAPEFSCDEHEEDNNDSEPLKDSPRLEPKKTLSVDDALAAALNGFLSTAITPPSEQIQTTPGHASKLDDKNQYQEHAESCQIKTKELPAAEGGNTESSQYAQVFTVKAPEFTAEEIGNEEHLNYTKSSLDISSVIKNEDKDHDSVMVPPSEQSERLSTSVDSCDLGENGIAYDLASAYNGDITADSVDVSRISSRNGHLDVIEGYFEGETIRNCVEASNGTAPDLAKDSVKANRHQNHDETKLGRTATLNSNNEEAASKQFLGYKSEIVSEVLERKGCFDNDTPHVSESSRASQLDFEFPILEVKFTSDLQTKSSVEALLDGAVDCNADSSSVRDDANSEEINAVVVECNETTDCWPIDQLLVDVGVPAAYGTSNLEDVSHNQSTTSSPLNLSLI